MQPAPIAAAPAGSAGRSANQDTGSGARRRTIVFVLVGIAAYALALLALMPASVLVPDRPWRTGAAGTVWNGEVGVAGGTSFEWRMAPLRSLTSLGFAADWKASGPDTDMGGRVLAHPGGRTVFDKVSGSADAGLLTALLPNLPFACEFTMQVEMDRIAMGGGARMLHGTVATDPGSCRPKGAGAASPVPALLLVAEHVGNRTMLRLSPFEQRRKLLVTATLAEDGTMDVSVTPDGAALLPFLGLPAGAQVQTRM